jgi:hypothetical protein
MEKNIQDQDPRRFIVPFLNPNPRVLTTDSSVERVVGGKLSTRAGHVLLDVTQFLEQRHGMSPDEQYGHLYPKVPKGSSFNGPDPDLCLTNDGFLLVDLLKQDNKNNQDIVWVRVVRKDKKSKTEKEDDVIYSRSEPGKEFVVDYNV